MDNDFEVGDRVLLLSGRNVESFAGHWNKSGLMDPWVGHIAVIELKLTSGGFSVRLETPEDVPHSVRETWIWDARCMKHADQIVPDEAFEAIFD